ncbi:tautomerase family protein [Acetivibrio cellulolyticus]|uniref:tautomerase family protein n=1 Tax=Acetivibrio cellulolyticus TaxID=35830 RepID=UPI0001E3019F|nr:tautomerase family protein [Acetivibrio cellulolyticus]
MPLTKISMIEGRTQEEKLKVAEGVHSALVTSFKIPVGDKNIRIDEYKKQDFILPEGKSEQYVVVEISAFSGRSTDAKRLLYRTIVENLRSLGIKPEDVFILLHEEPLENWGIRGGIAACDIDFGFNVKV